MSIRSRMVFSLLLGVFVSCATTRYEEYGPPPEAADTRGEVRVESVVITEYQMLTARIRAMEQRLTDLELSIQSKLDRPDSADVLARVSALSDQVQELRRQIPLGRSSSTKQAFRPSVPGLPVTVMDVRVLYEDALQAFDMQDYGQARKLFGQILTQDGRGSLADNAQYWLGECAYAVEDYTGGLEAFKRVFQFSETEKDDDAQLKLGFCYLRLGDPESALIEFKRLTVDYPQSEYLIRAEEQIRQIRAAKASRP